MARSITLKAPRPGSAQLRDPRLISYNIEMAEVTGGTFWKPFTPAQVAGADEVPPLKLPEGESPSMSQMLAATSELMSERPPADLSHARLRKLAAALGPSWVRVSGSWATGTYFDHDGRCDGEPPKGYRAVLTRDQWAGVLDFVDAVGAKLLTSFAVNPALDSASCRELGGTGAWDPAQVRRILNMSSHRGVPVSAVEFVNEPNISFFDAPGYLPARYLQDQDAFYHFMRIEFPTVLLAGPCGAMDPIDPDAPAAGAMARLAGQAPSSEQLARHATEKPDAYSYHIYAGMSERGAAMGGHHWEPGEAASDPALAVADKARRYHARVRDAWCPGAPLWVTESGDANCGGNTWGSTFLDVFRTADELARFSAAEDGAIFHNTLASSDYGLLDEETYAPRPNWWFLWLWRQLAGNGAYDAHETMVEPLAPACAHAYARTHADGKPGTVYLVINNSLIDELVVQAPAPCTRFTLSSPKAPKSGSVTSLELRSTGVLLNGAPLELGEGDALPALDAMGAPEAAGEITLQPGTVTFLVA